MLNQHQIKMTRKRTERAIYYSEHSWEPELSEAFRKMVQTSRNTGKPHTHATEIKRRLGL